jgi:DnaJ like chaperone protein
MSFLKTALFYMIGSAIGGPIGGLLAAIVGSQLSGRASASSSRQSFNSNEQQQAAFFATLFACLAKLAKSDGHVSQEEIDKIDVYMHERFKFGPEQRDFARKAFNHAKDDTVTYEEYATQLASLLRTNKNSLVMFYELLFELAMADGVLDKQEAVLLKKTTSIFGIDPDLFGRLKQQFADSTFDPYVVLGVDKATPFAEIKKSYQRKRKEFHPDTLISKGLPEELLAKAQENFIRVQEAYKILESKKDA